MYTKNCNRVSSCNRNKQDILRVYCFSNALMEIAPKCLGVLIFLITCGVSTITFEFFMCYYALRSE